MFLCYSLLTQCSRFAPTSSAAALQVIYKNISEPSVAYFYDEVDHWKRCRKQQIFFSCALQSEFILYRFVVFVMKAEYIFRVSGDVLLFLLFGPLQRAQSSCACR